MAVPTVVSKQGALGPADSRFPANTDGVQGIRISLTLIGSNANTLTDFATLAAQNFACGSATLTYEKT